jgi:hypothetical protein
MLDRIEPAVNALIIHVEERTGYEEPQPTLAEFEPDGSGAGDGTVSDEGSD